MPLQGVEDGRRYSAKTAPERASRQVDVPSGRSRGLKMPVPAPILAAARPVNGEAKNQGDILQLQKLIAASTMAALALSVPNVSAATFDIPFSGSIYVWLTWGGGGTCGNPDTTDPCSYTQDVTGTIELQSDTVVEGLNYGPGISATIDFSWTPPELIGGPFSATSTSPYQFTFEVVDGQLHAFNIDVDRSLTGYTLDASESAISFTSPGNHSYYLVSGVPSVPVALSVPEPANAALLLAGMATLALMRRRRC